MEHKVVVGRKRTGQKKKRVQMGGTRRRRSGEWKPEDPCKAKDVSGRALTRQWARDVYCMNR